MKIRFTADSTCDMSADFIERYQVKVFPLSVQMGDKLYKDGIDITPDEIIQRVNGGENLPKTSAVNAAEYREVFEEMLRDCDAILHFSISSEMSCSYQNACLAAEDLPVYCVDSRSLSSGIALLLAEAADMAEEGKDGHFGGTSGSHHELIGEIIIDIVAGAVPAAEEGEIVRALTDEAKAVFAKAAADGTAQDNITYKNVADFVTE